MARDYSPDEMPRTIADEVEEDWVGFVAGALRMDRDEVARKLAEAEKRAR